MSEEKDGPMEITAENKDANLDSLLKRYKEQCRAAPVLVMTSSSVKTQCW
jgi:hypothetical protein